MHPKHQDSSQHQKAFFALPSRRKPGLQPTPKTTNATPSRRLPRHKPTPKSTPRPPNRRSWTLGSTKLLTDLSSSFSLGVQQDSSELLSLLFSKISELTETVHQKARFTLSSEVLCSVCHRIFFTSSEGNLLSLPISFSRTVCNALARLFEPEQLRGDNRYRCSHCKIGTDANKILQIGSASDILIMHLRRFDFGLNVHKIVRHISFQETLSLNDTRWSLRAVVEHTNNSTQHGHYVAYKRTIDGAWWIINDESTNKINFQQVQT
jgi:uncharacterized UBP type Zn finger protein